MIYRLKVVTASIFEEMFYEFDDKDVNSVKWDTSRRFPDITNRNNYKSKRKIPINVSGKKMFKVLMLDLTDSLKMIIREDNLSTLSVGNGIVKRLFCFNSLALGHSSRLFIQEIRFSTGFLKANLQKVQKYQSRYCSCFQNNTIRFAWESSHLLETELLPKSSYL